MCDLQTHREFLFLLPVWSVGRWLGAASVHAVVWIVLCYRTGEGCKRSEKEAESKSFKQTHVTLLPLHLGLQRACKTKKSHLEMFQNYRHRGRMKVHLIARSYDKLKINTITFLKQNCTLSCLSIWYIRGEKALRLTRIRGVRQKAGAADTCREEIWRWVLPLVSRLWRTLSTSHLTRSVLRVWEPSNRQWPFIVKADLLWRAVQSRLEQETHKRAQTVECDFQMCICF